MVDKKWLEDKGIVMKIYGYQRNHDELLDMQEVSFQCSLEEIEKIIQFLNKVRDEHGKVKDRTKICHSHLRDYDADWEKDTDLIIVTSCV